LYRFKIIIQYDGSSFSGWQIQKNKKTVQGELENALKTISGSKDRIAVHGAGRTDSGVHAYGQVAHFDLDTNLRSIDLRNAINSNISQDCKIMSLEQVDSDFESRFDAIKRKYRYQVYLGNSLLFRNQAWLINDIEINILEELSELIIGENDFLSFSKYRPEQKNTSSIIYESAWKKKDKLLTYEISGNRFLHHMVRYLVGTMVQVSRGRYPKVKFSSLLHEPRKNVQIHRAPANGLILLKVMYDKYQ
tara:strand:- start:1746 stop:2489 length:744 start_codon:yes stop_codon:yes gene_type:complete